MPGSAPSAVRRLADGRTFIASGQIELSSRTINCELSVGPEGLTAAEGGRTVLAWPACEIHSVRRDDYDIAVEHAFDDASIVLSRFARRTDELEGALRRTRADALARLMAPPGMMPLDVFETVDDRPGLLFRYSDGLRRVPHEGDCRARLYAEIREARFDPDEYALVLGGPFGETRIGGLRRLTRELADETRRHARAAREDFADALENAGLDWRDEAETGQILAHAPIEATEARLEGISKSRIICDERREYWDIIVDEGAVECLALSPRSDGLRCVAICRASDGELYEVLSEPDHASFLFEDVRAVVQAWTEVGFRREPIFDPTPRDASAALARVLPSLRAAREGLIDRVIHTEPRMWRDRLFT